MPDILWVNDNGAMTVREVDDKGNLIPPSQGGQPIVDALDDDAKFGTFTGEPKKVPFGGKGDHDGNGKVGGAAPPLKGKRK